MAEMVLLKSHVVHDIERVIRTVMDDGGNERMAARQVYQEVVVPLLEGQRPAESSNPPPDSL
jgi:hypothetical protein